MLLSRYLSPFPFPFRTPHPHPAPTPLTLALVPNTNTNTATATLHQHTHMLLAHDNAIRELQASVAVMQRLNAQVSLALGRVYGDGYAGGEVEGRGVKMEVEE